MKKPLLLRYGYSVQPLHIYICLEHAFRLELIWYRISTDL